MKRLIKRVREARAKLAHLALGLPIAEQRIAHHQRQLEVFVQAKDAEAIKRAKAYLRRWRRRRSFLLRAQKHWKAALRNRAVRLRHYRKTHDVFAPHMANGNPWEKLTDQAKAGIARDFSRGLYVTSTYEGYPGDGVHATGSGHYLQNQPDGRGRCWDAAGGWDAMNAAQNEELALHQADLIELLGPDNDAEVKNGLRYTLPEGSALEQMHDTHKHEWLE